jgi:hypothetical protein
MKGKWILPLVCALVMVTASSGVAAVLHNFGTATTELEDDDVTATAPVINDWEYKLEVELAAYLDVEVTCQFKDKAGAVDDFSFYFLLTIDLWEVSPPQFYQPYGTDSWSELNEDSTNWANVPVIHEETLSIEIAWIPEPHEYMYKCTLDVYITNDDVPVSDSDQETWFITCALN